MTQMIKTESLGRKLLRKLIPLLIILAGVVAVAVIYKISVDETPPQVVPPRPVNVVVQQVRVIPTMSDEFILDATVEPNRVVKVAAEVEGRIERYGQYSQPGLQNSTRQVQEGDFIQAAQPLVHLNTDLLQAAYDQAKAQYEFELRNYDRIREAQQRNVATKKELDQASTSLALSEATLDEVKAKLDRTTIFSPISGTVNRLLVEIGEFVQPGMTCAEIVDDETIKIVVNASERDIGYFQVGQEQKIFVDHNGQPIVLSGRITYISVEAEPLAHTTRMEISFHNTDYIFHSGQFVKARLKRQDLKNVIMVPLDAIIPLEDGYIVYVVEDGKAQPRGNIQIDILSIKGKQIRVVAGLADGEQLIVQGNWMCGPGQEVNIIRQQPEQPLTKADADAQIKQQGE